MLTADQVRHAEFVTVRLMAGYDMRAVDDLLKRVIATLEGYELGTSVRAVTAGELAKAGFTITRLREGYQQGEVDELIENVITTLREHESSASKQSSVNAAAANSPWADLHAPGATPSGAAARRGTGGALTANEIVHHLQSLQAVQPAELHAAPVWAQTPDGRNFAISAVTSTPSGLIVALTD